MHGPPPQEDDYAAAWRLATVNRVDLNLIVDYAWPRFLSHARDFVAAVVDDQAVCDLLAALRPDSVAAPGGSYVTALPSPPSPSTVSLPCDLLGALRLPLLQPVRISQELVFGLWPQ